MQENNQTPTFGKDKDISPSGQRLAETQQNIVTAVNSYPRGRFSGLYWQAVKYSYTIDSIYIYKFFLSSKICTRILNLV
jgi:hypothetical protein